MKNFVKIAGATSVLAMAVASAGAVADPLTALGFSQNAGWNGTPGEWEFDATNATNLVGLTFTDALVGPNDPAGTYASMEWADTGNSQGNNIRTSKLTVEGFDQTDTPSLGDVNLSGGGVLYPADANGEWNAGEFWIITELLQENQALRGDVFPNPLWIAEVIANLYITSADGSEVFKPDEGRATTIAFWETKNSGLCAGRPNPLETICDDVYRVSDIELADISFNLDGYKYTIEFDLLPGPDSTDGVSLVCNAVACSDGVTDPVALGIPADDLWVFTREDNPGNSSLFVTAAWSAREIVVPEPSMLALLGIGVLGAGFASRRRKQA